MHTYPEVAVTKVIIEMTPLEATVLRECLINTRADTWGAGTGPERRPVALQMLSTLPNAIRNAINQETDK